MRSQLNQIRLWVRQGRTDAWIAHKLDVSIEQLERFKRDHDLEGDGAARGRPADPLSVPPPEADLSYEEEEADEEEPEEAPVGALLEEPEPEEADAEPPVQSRARDARRRPRAAEAADEDTDEGQAAPRRRRRGRRGGRRRRRPSSFEATFDHGEEEGYGLWLDPAVVDDPVYAQHWAGQRAVVVTFDRDAITIRRANAGPSEGAEHGAGDADSDQ